MKRTLTTGLFLTLLAPTAVAQFMLADQFGVSDGDNFGWATAFLGDLDGDGFLEWASGAPSATAGGRTGAGRVSIYSGRTGVEIRAHEGTQINMGLGTAVVDHGDINGDGVSDYAISAPGFSGPVMGSGRVMVYSGVDGSVLRLFGGTESSSSFGRVLDAGGDVNGDGVQDLAIAEPGSSHQAYGGGRVRVFSGANGALLFTASGTTQLEGRGQSTAIVEDVDGDGLDDVVAGAPFASFNDVRIYSGRTGALIRSIAPQIQVDHRMGLAVDGMGDVDGDGLGDVLVATNEARQYAPGGGVIYLVGRVRIHSGLTGAVITEVEGAQQRDSVGRYAKSIADRDGDGLRDFAAFKRYGSDRLVVYSSATGAVLAEHAVEVTTSNGFGTSFSGAADVNGDGVEDFLVGNQRWPFDDYRGRAILLSGKPPVGTDATCDPFLPMSIAKLTVQGSESVGGNDLTLHVTGVPTSTFGYFLTSRSTQLGPNFGGALSLCLGGATPIGRYAGNVLQPSSTGFVQQTIDLNSIPTPTGAVSASAGETHFFQLWFRRGTGSDFSTTIGVTFQ